MGQNLDVEIADMDLIAQVFTRQREHFEKLDSYVASNCRAEGALTGALSFVAGDYNQACDDAKQGFDNGKTIATTCATKIGETKAAMLETDKKQYERYAEHERSLGHTVPPYTPPPGGGTLGAADDSAPDAAGAAAKWKIDGTYPERLKKIGEVLAVNPNDPWKRTGPSGADYLDTKFWAKRGVEQAWDGARHGLGYGTPIGRHSFPDAKPMLPDGTGSTIKGAASIISTPISAVNNGYGIVVAGQHVQAAQATHEGVQASVDGPSNSGGIDWANSQTGGDW